MSHYSVYVFQNEDSLSIDDMLEPYDEKIELQNPIIAYTKEEAIRKVRKNIEDYSKSDEYNEFLKDKDAYKKKYGNNTEHIDYIENEFPKRLTWTDEDCYEYIKTFYDKDMIDEDGSLLTVYNPKSKWDWYEVGGRWSGALNTKNGKNVNKSILKDIDITKTNTPFAFVTPDGEWVEQGQMGWFGISEDEMDDTEWDKKFWEYTKGLKKTTVVTVVDCHI